MPDIVVFDTGPLHHFAQAGWLGFLKVIVGEGTAVIPDVVADELRAAGLRDGRISGVLNERWIQVRELQTDEELRS